jgi:preprotein translocase subunit SecG
MFDILIVAQVTICLLLIIAILLNRSDGSALSGLSSGADGGVVSTKTANMFLMKVTIFLVAAFMINSIILANLTVRKFNSQKIIEKIDKQDDSSSIPIAQ